jgi:hypothetical protein
MRTRIKAVGAAAVLLGAATLAAAPSANADTSLAHLAGTAAVSSGTVVLMVEQPTAFDAQGMPTTLTDTPVATSSVAPDGSFSVPLPDTATVRDAADDGWVNTVTEVAKDNQFTLHHDSVLIAPSGDAGSTDEITPAGGTVNEGQTPAMITAPTNVENGVAPHAIAMDPSPCQWYRQSTTEPTNRVGEVHVADVSGASATFEYHTKADSHFEIGVSVSKGPYNAAGHGSVTNSLSTSAGFTDYRNDKHFANTQMYWGKYVNNGAVTCTGVMHKVMAIKSAGDVFRGPNQPGTKSGTCHANSHGYGIVPANGFFSSDRATAHEYGVVSDAYGFSAGGHTGYTNGIHITLKAKSTRTYFCGDRAVPNMSIIWNKKY